MFPRVIVITGTPGVGKSTVSKALAERLKDLYVDLNDLVKRENLILSWDSKRDTFVANLMELKNKVSQIIDETSLDVVVDGHYASFVVSPNRLSYVFVLRMEPYKLGERLRERGYEEKKVLENMASEILDVCLVDAIGEYGSERLDEIDVTKMDVEDVVEEILMVLDGRRKSRVGLVDWLDRLEREGKLDQVLTLLDKI